ncbi:MAG: AarF/ABC1/UbiB kinase family protein, partial [Planctomycetes bacterium]|nr:AarF/ABC1/UbiB kinase family protein [Planctomycetota bacterium]
DLVAAWPGDEAEETPQEALQDLIQKLSMKKVPVGALNRLWVMGSLHAKIAVSYLAHWIKASLSDQEKKVRLRNETHMKAAFKLLSGMGYLRGAVMKVGQVLANYPDVVPEQFVDVLGRLHFEAPPMHFSLLREFVRNELGANPEELFDAFETRAFAAASLGQVHRARLKGTGTRVAVKIQYPNIARTIHDDFKNMKAMIFPMRLHPDWDSLHDQFEDIRLMLDMEVDYEQEAKNMRIGRAAFTENDGIVVPKVFPELSTSRVLTMEYLEGTHLDEYLAGKPEDADRDRFGFLIAKSAFRLMYQSRMLHCDPHPGNYIFMPDGRLGFIDFGSCRHFERQELEMTEGVERAMLKWNPELPVSEELADAMSLVIDEKGSKRDDKDRIALSCEFCIWAWAPLNTEGPFDFGNLDYFRQGVRIYGELLRKRYIRSRPVNTWMTRSIYGVRALLTRLRARVDFRKAWKEETPVR